MTKPQAAQAARPDSVEVYERFQKMACKAAWRLHITTGLPYDELQAEATGILALKSVEWKTTEAKVSACTFIYRNLWWGLIAYCRKNKTAQNTISLGTAPAAHRRLVTSKGYVESLWETIGEEARVVLSTIVNAPAEIADDVARAARNRAKARAAVKDYLVKQGWDPLRFHAAWREVAACL
jgi:hypothetical protein